MKDVTISIASIVKGGICVAADDGNRVNNEIAKNIDAGNRVVISFSGITRMTTAFLNAAVGQLYGSYNEEKLRQHLAPPINAEPWQLNRLKLVVDRAKQYFSNPDPFRSALDKATGSDDE